MAENNFSMPFRPLEAAPNSDEPRERVNIASHSYGEPVDVAIPHELKVHAIRQIETASQYPNHPAVEDVRAQAVERLRRIRAAVAEDLVPEAPVHYRKRAVAQLEKGAAEVQTWAQGKLDAATKELNDRLGDLPSRRPNTADHSWWNQLFPSLQVLTASVAVPILRRALIKDVIAEGRSGRATLALPWLESKYESDQSWRTPDMHSLLRDIGVVRQGSDFHDVQVKAMTVARASAKLAQIIAVFVGTEGDLEKHPYARTGWFSEFGVTVEPAEEYDAEADRALARGAGLSARR